MAPGPGLDYLAGMRAGMVVLVVSVASGTLTLDPDLAKPWGARRAAAVVVGTGATDYLPIGTQGVPIETAPALGTNSLWLGVACRGLGLDVNLSSGVINVATGHRPHGHAHPARRARLRLGLRPGPMAAGLFGCFALPRWRRDRQGSRRSRWPASDAFRADASDACRPTPIRSAATT